MTEGNPGAATRTMRDDDDGDMTIDFGFVPNLSIGSTVFYDLDGDGRAGRGQPTGKPVSTDVLVLLSIDTSEAMDGSMPGRDRQRY